MVYNFSTSSKESVNVFVVIRCNINNELDQRDVSVEHFEFSQKPAESNRISLLT